MKIFVFVLFVSLVQIISANLRDVNACVEGSICAYEYIGDNNEKSVTRCDCPATFTCVEQEFDFDLSANIFRCRPQAAPPIDVHCEKDAICAYQFHEDLKDKTVQRCTCPKTHKCVQQEEDLDLSAFIFRCKANEAPRPRFTNICDENAICAYGFFGDNVDRKPHHHKLSR